MCLRSIVVLGAALAALGAGRAPVIVLDPGHGGANLGAQGVHGQKTLQEKHVTLALARAVQARLERHSDVRVMLTRSGDDYVGLKARTELANQLKADLFLSIHCNSSSSPGARGFETWFLSTDGAEQGLHREKIAGFAGTSGGAVRSIVTELASAGVRSEGARLADAVRGGLASMVTAPDRGVRAGDFTVLAGARVPASVVEVGFLNHPVEGPALDTRAYQGRLADGLAKGILEFLAQAGQLGEGGGGPLL